MIFEYVGNMHMHTPYSDGEASHSEIAQAAQSANLDFVIVTDHNIRVDGVQGYYGDTQRGYVLLLTGEEVHDRLRQPQLNHCLVYGTPQQMSPYAEDSQKLIDTVKANGGLTFLAHPCDERIDWHPNLRSIAWVDWGIDGYNGLEIWNYMSVFKESIKRITSLPRNIFDPDYAVVGPRQETLAKWDELLASGRRIVGIGNSDAHGTQFQLGPIKHTVFHYDFLFHCVNTHIQSTVPFSGHWQQDEQLIYNSLRRGAAFISYGLVGNARGFRFSAQGNAGQVAQMGEGIHVGNGITLQTVAPARGHIKLIRHGVVVAEERDTENLTYNAMQSGAYRVEVWREYRGKERCWILSNPIYIEQ